MRSISSVTLRPQGGSKIRPLSAASCSSGATSDGATVAAMPYVPGSSQGQHK
jgi:hypothetical protein